MTQHQTLQVAVFSPDGQLISDDPIDLPAIDQAGVEHFVSRLQRLSGDLELPLEEPITSLDDVLLQICSDHHDAAYCVYYHQGEPVVASLFLAGRDFQAEFELMQVFKFLLLDTEDDDEPDEETLQAILEAPEFDFDSLNERPLAIQIQLMHGEAQLDQQCESIMTIDQQIAAAFFQLESLPRKN